jgi:hypothetical protein
MESHPNIDVPDGGCDVLRLMLVPIMGQWSLPRLSR